MDHLASKKPGKQERYQYGGHSYRAVYGYVECPAQVEILVQNFRDNKIGKINAEGQF